MNGSMSSTTDAVISIRRFLHESSSYLLEPSLLLKHLHPSGANHIRCELFGVPPFQTVSYDDVFSGRILYESSFYGNLLMILTSSSFSLSSTYRVSAECEFKIKQNFQTPSTASCANPQHAGQLISAASCTVEVLLKCHPAIHLFNGLQHNQPFIRALIGSVGVHTSLPPFSWMHYSSPGRQSCWVCGCWHHGTSHRWCFRQQQALILGFREGVAAYKWHPMWVTDTHDCIMCFAWHALPQSAIQLWIFWFLLECAKDGAYLKYFINCFTMWLIKMWPKLSTIWICYEYFERVGYNWSILLIHNPMAPKWSWSCTDWISFGGLL